MSDEWRIVTHFPVSTYRAHARARESDNSKNLSLPVTCHSGGWEGLRPQSGRDGLKLQGKIREVLL